MLPRRVPFSPRLTFGSPNSSASHARSGRPHPWPRAVTMMQISELLALQLASVVKAIIPLYARLRMGSFLSKIPAGV
jgi:hypothetical protein